MAKSLVIVESPTKAQTIAKYLGKGYQVKASVGHIKDLPKGELGVDIKNQFSPTYVVLASKKKVIKEIQTAASNADHIFLACDPDREGEAIAWHLAEELQKKLKKKTIRRILVHEITKKAIQEALTHPKELDKNLYEAQQARRILDRIVGYQISPLLWDKVKRGLSAGRVQSVAVRLVCEREKEIKAFKAEEYWSLDFSLQGEKPPPFLARVINYKGEKLAISNAGEAKKIEAEVRPSKLILGKVIKKERRRHAPAPFITSRLQQDASQKLGFSPKKTMMIAQQLYEGIELGEEGPVGLITYMRTDSTRVSNDVINEVRDIIAKKFGKDFLPEGPNYFKNKKAAQDAHEAIRPTSLDHSPEKVHSFLSKDQIKLYDLIWKRFLASQMASAVFDQTTFEIQSGDYGLRASGSQIKFPGFLAVYQIDREVDLKEGEEEAEEGILPDLAEGSSLTILDSKPEQHFTEPPPRFTEASLIKELEEKGIGRPSTYAAILSTIVDKQYVKKERNVFCPTQLGGIVNDLLVESFPEILNVQFTAQMEEELDEVEEGRRTYVETLNDFYKPFEKTLARAKIHMKDIKRQEIKTDLSCEKCGSPMMIKWGRRGEFIACSNYPECRYTREFERNDSGDITLLKLEVTGEFCSTCGGQMIIKSGKFGKFLACSNYPTCKTTRALSIGINCPDCSGKLVERKTKRGLSFYGCMQYPKCKFATWDRPINEPCPTCGSAFLVVKRKKSGDEIRCPKKGCDYTKSSDAQPADTV
ncbi:MAG: type I DNA topoisomerase [Deltaproteobacteria bacterium]|nr:type I DNA topoisomerase [Deltaproteobacteria bacterium]